MAQTQASAALLPFHGIRFRSDVPGGFRAVIGPPADIESDDSARAFVRGRPYSAVQLEVSDAPGDLRFARARELLARWRSNGVLRADPSPSYYLYEQEFTLQGVRLIRRGLFGLVPLDATQVSVLPHEGTWEDNRARRLQLLRELDASLSPILLLYEPTSPTIPDMLARLSEEPPDASDSDDFGESHRVWRISNPELIAEIARYMAGQAFIIADGHHRFEAARLFHEAQRRPETGVTLALCVATTDPGLALLPIHRLVRLDANLDWSALLTHLERWFRVNVQSVGILTAADLVGELGTGSLPSVGLLGPGGVEFAVLTLHSWQTLEDAGLDMRHAVTRLDVVTASELLVNRGISSAGDAEIDFTNDADGALLAVRSGSSQLAILLRQVRLEQVLDVAHANERMPPKTTSFVPKVPIGLVMHDFQSERG